MQYNSIEELEAYFKDEIKRVSDKEIKAIEAEMEEIRKKVISEMEESAKRSSVIITEQEMKEMTSEHAIALSRLQDESNRKLMDKRRELTTSLFEEVTEKLRQFSSTPEYVSSMVRKLKALVGKYKSHAIIFVGAEDEKLLPQFIEAYQGDIEGSVDKTIELGGFRLRFENEGIVIDETFDTTLKDEKEKFYSNSNLIIS